MPEEPNKLRPAVVVERDGLFVAVYPNVLLVPLTEDRTLAIPDLSVALVPSPENGCTKPCWAVAQMVTATSKERVRPTSSCVTAEQLVEIRRQIAFAVGFRI